MSLNKLPNTTEDNLLSREELIALKKDLKTNFTPKKITERKKSLVLTNVNNPQLSKTVESISEA